MDQAGSNGSCKKWTDLGFILKVGPAQQATNWKWDVKEWEQRHRGKVQSLYPSSEVNEGAIYQDGIFVGAGGNQEVYFRQVNLKMPI